MSLCIGCVRKWKLFQHDPKKDYTKAVASSQTKFNMEHKDVKIELISKPSREKGDV